MNNDCKKHILAALRHFYTVPCGAIEKGASSINNCGEPDSTGCLVSQSLRIARLILADWYLFPGMLDHVRDEINTILYYAVTDTDRIAAALRKCVLRYPEHGAHNGTTEWLDENCEPESLFDCFRAVDWADEVYQMNGE